MAIRVGISGFSLHLMEEKLTLDWIVYTSIYMLKF
jgi:hypothetical protein